MDQTKDIEKQYDKIYKYCYYKLQQKEIAEDITQETFLRFYEKEPYPFRETPMRLLYTVARNLCIDEYRKMKSISLEENESAVQEQLLRASRPAEEDILTSNMLRAAMEKLNETERDIVFLRLVNEETFSVIAEMFGLSRYAVYRRYENALKTLRKELE